MNNENLDTQTNINIINDVYSALKNREIHPSGKFDSAGRWYAKHDDLINVRWPSRAFPYSQMTACRTKKYVKKVAEKFGCMTVADLRAHV